MAKVNDIVFFFYLTNLPGQGASAHTILSTMTPEYIPGLFTFSVVITILDINKTADHTFKVTFSSPNEVVGVISGSFPALNTQNNLPDEYKGINLVVNCNNMNMKESGEYTLLVALDDDQIGEKKIFVKGKNES